MKEHDEHKNLRGLGYQSVIPYVYEEGSCIAILCCSNLGLNLAKRVLRFRPPFSTSVCLILL
jgi:hypothetical protein